MHFTPENFLRHSLAWLLVLCMAAVAEAPQDSAGAIEEPAVASESALPQSNLRAVFNDGLLHLRGLEQYTASGMVTVHYQAADGPEQELQYFLSLAKPSPHHLAITVLNADDGALVQKLVLAGQQGQATLYLPRATAMTAAASVMMGAFPDTLTLALVMPLFEYLEYTRPDRWHSRMGATAELRTETLGTGEAHFLGLSLNNYFSLRDYELELWLDAEEAPLLQRMAVDLSRALEARGVGGIIAAGTRLRMELDLDTWSPGEAPHAEALAAPGGEDEFETVDVAGLLAADGDPLLAGFSLAEVLGGDMLPGGGLPGGASGGRLPAGVSRGQVPTRGPGAGGGGQMPSAAERAQIISRLRNASPAERERIVQELRTEYGGASGGGRAGGAQRMQARPQGTQGVNNTTRGGTRPRR